MLGLPSERASPEQLMRSSATSGCAELLRRNKAGPGDTLHDSLVAHALRASGPQAKPDIEGHCLPQKPPLAWHKWSHLCFPLGLYNGNPSWRWGSTRLPGSLQQEESQYAVTHPQILQEYPQYRTRARPGKKQSSSLFLLDLKTKQLRRLWINRRDQMDSVYRNLFRPLSRALTR